MVMLESVIFNPFDLNSLLFLLMAEQRLVIKLRQLRDMKLTCDTERCEYVFNQIRRDTKFILFDMKEESLVLLLRVVL